ncbi:MAG: M28 family peptidase [Xenococcaceae cyanobacterium]
MKIIKEFSLKRLLILIMLFACSPVFFVWIIIAQPTFSKNKPSSVKIEKIKLKNHVRILSNQYHPKNWREIENLNRAAEYIYSHFKKSGARTSFQEYKIGVDIYKNVIGIYGPPSNKRIIIGAHYDTNEDTPGADDNASGVAALIELGYLLGKEKLTKEIELVAYTLEEPPFFGTKNMGSAIHAKSLHSQGIKVQFMISLETIGYFSDEKNSQLYPIPLLKLFYPNKGDFIALVGDLRQRSIVRQMKKYMKGSSDLPVYSINAPSFVPGIDYSDHRNYWEYGIDAFMITDTAFYRNLEYHQKGDTADRLDYERLSKVVVQVFEGVIGIIKAEQNNRGDQ